MAEEINLPISIDLAPESVNLDLNLMIIYIRHDLTN